jgi:hypothetical protein
MKLAAVIQTKIYLNDPANIPSVDLEIFNLKIRWIIMVNKPPAFMNELPKSDRRFKRWPLILFNEMHLQKCWLLLKKVVLNWNNGIYMHLPMKGCPTTENLAKCVKSSRKVVLHRVFKSSSNLTTRTRKQKKQNSNVHKTTVLNWCMLTSNMYNDFNRDVRQFPRTEQYSQGNNLSQNLKKVKCIGSQKMRTWLNLEEPKGI